MTEGTLVVDAWAQQLNREFASQPWLEGDPYCRPERFGAFRAALGDRFHERVLPDGSAGTVGWLGVPHSVVTTSLVDVPGEPTANARDEILDFFRARLSSGPDQEAVTRTPGAHQ